MRFGLCCGLGSSRIDRACGGPYTQRVSCGGAAATQRIALRRPLRVCQRSARLVACKQGLLGLLTHCFSPRQRVWRLQPWLGLAQQGRLRTDLAAGRGVRRLPRQQGAILQCRHCQPLGVHCHRPSSGHVSTSLGRLPSPVSSASSRSPAIVGIARELADGAKTKLEISDQGLRQSEWRKSPGC